MSTEYFSPLHGYFFKVQLLAGMFLDKFPLREFFLKKVSLISNGLSLTLFPSTVLVVVWVVTQFLLPEAALREEANNGCTNQLAM